MITRPLVLLAALTVATPAYADRPRAQNVTVRNRVEVSPSTDGIAEEGDTYPVSQAYSPTSSAHECDSVGAGAQAGGFGLSVGTITEACRAYRTTEVVKYLTEQDYYFMSRLVLAQYYLGYPFRTLGHMATGGAMN